MNSYLSLIPAIIAIIVSLLTKEVILSLGLGLIVGVGLFVGFSPLETVTTTFDIIINRLYDNMGVIIFIIFLGEIIILMGKSGATRKYAAWAAEKLRDRKQTMLTAFLLGLLMFVDDYFSCVTVGTVIRPISDRNRISRQKLSFIIDALAAPICMIAPLSSWAAAVSSSLPEETSINGFQLFIKAIPTNFYSLGMIAFVIGLVVFNSDFGSMKKAENRAIAGEIGVGADKADKSFERIDGSEGKGGVLDLLLPVIVLIVFSILGMLYTGGFFAGGISIIDAFADCDAITGLVLSTFFTVLFMAVLYLPRRVVTVRTFLDSLTEGFRYMVPSILILTLAWSLGAVCGSDYLNAGGYIGEVVENSSFPLGLIPAIFFIIAAVLAFSTGTSWGTFAILLPIALSIWKYDVNAVSVLATGAVLAGSVTGDHLSPISDTTILSSASGECEHYQHFTTQLPYGIAVALASFVGYLVAGLTKLSFIGLIITLGLVIGLNALTRRE